MTEIRYSLVTDGPTDQRLLPILTWLLHEHAPEYAVQSEWADLRHLRRPPTRLIDKIEKALELYPCDLLFVHRDAEREPRSHRVKEINAAKKAVAACNVLPVICVVPIRMQEAWLLFDKAALFHAAENPNGKHKLQMPTLARLEDLPDPKQILEQLLIEACGLPTRRVGKGDIKRWAHRLPGLIDDFAPLRALSAFRILEADLIQIIHQQGWNR